jgi:ATP-dependent Clp protease protease subunit
MEEIVAHHTGQTVETIHADLDRDFILTADAAKEYGVVDQVITRRELVPVPVAPPPPPNGQAAH